ncbi:MAG: low molecular weight phosphatase family protein [Ornithinibacter sp.]
MATSDPTPQPTGQVHLLTVCTGNICRSPYAAVLLRDGLQWARPGAFVVTSAGTHALVGRPMDEGSAVRLGAKGLADDAFRARLLTARLLEQQAVVLLMAGEHREPVLDEAPAVHRRTFTLRELASTLDEIGERHDWGDLLAAVGAHDVASRWQALPGLVAAHRDRGRARARRADRDVADPYARGDRAFDGMVAQVDPAVRSIVLWERQFPR